MSQPHEGNGEPDMGGQSYQRKHRGPDFHVNGGRPAVRLVLPATESWWTRPMARDEFQRRARAEQNRMELGKFGRVSTLAMVDP